MTAFDPYHILDVSRSAAPAAIKTAYRQRVQVTHPDRGGDPEQFISIVKAFGILSDPEARRRFDETGIVDEDTAKSYRNEVITILADVFDAAVKSAVETSLPLIHVDFIGQMTLAIEGNARDTSRTVLKLNSEIEQLIALRTRIRRNDEHVNLFVERLNAQVKLKTEQHAMVGRRVAILEAALVELGNYNSEIELISALQLNAK